MFQVTTVVGQVWRAWLEGMKNSLLNGGEGGLFRGQRWRPFCIKEPIGGPRGLCTERLRKMNIKPAYSQPYDVLAF